MDNNFKFFENLDSEELHINKVNPPYEGLLLMFKKLIDSNKISNLLEIGCGTANNLPSLEKLLDKKIKYHGVDLNLQFLKQAQLNYPDQTFLQGNYLNLYKTLTLIDCLCSISTLIYFDANSIHQYLKSVEHLQPKYILNLEIISEKTLPILKYDQEVLFGHNFIEMYKKIGYKVSFLQTNLKPIYVDAMSSSGFYAVVLASL